MTFPTVVGLLSLVVGCVAVIFQIVSGVAIISLEHHVERRKAPVHFWVIVGIEAFGVLVGVLSLFAFS